MSSAGRTSNPLSVHSLPERRPNLQAIPAGGGAGQGASGWPRVQPSCSADLTSGAGLARPMLPDPKPCRGEKTGEVSPALRWTVRVLSVFYVRLCV
jgi:hypothetical protein